MLLLQKEDVSFSLLSVQCCRDGSLLFQEALPYPPPSKPQTPGYGSSPPRDVGALEQAEGEHRESACSSSWSRDDKLRPLTGRLSS